MIIYKAESNSALYFPEGVIMSKNDTHLKWHRLALIRAIGYLSPVLVFLLAKLWFRPQNEVGWVAVWFVTAVSVVIVLATLAHARNEAHSKRMRFNDDGLSIMTDSVDEELVPARPPFAGPRGAQPMEDWLQEQP